MSTTTITGLKNEITRLERELEKHRRALRLLEGGEGRATQPPARPERPTPQKGIKVLIQEVLTARAPEKLTPSEIVEYLAQQGHGPNLKNIHNRLSELAKAKAVKRQAGRYWMQQKQRVAKS